MSYDLRDVGRDVEEVAVLLVIITLGIVTIAPAVWWLTTAFCEYVLDPLANALERRRAARLSEGTTNG